MHMLGNRLTVLTVLRGQFALLPSESYWTKYCGTLRSHPLSLTPSEQWRLFPEVFDTDGSSSFAALHHARSSQHLERRFCKLC